MKIQNSEKAFLTKLQALYDVEKAIEKALPKMHRAAGDEELKDGFRRHLSETKTQIRRLEEAFRLLGVKARKIRSPGIRGIIDEGTMIMKADAPDDIADAMLASAARHVEHYEMAGYLAAIEQADALGLDEIAGMLRESLEEEERADELLAIAAQKTFEQSKV